MIGRKQGGFSRYAQVFAFWPVALAQAGGVGGELPEKSFHLGFGAITCRAFQDGIGQQAASEMRQYFLGYLSAIDPDLFSLGESNSAIQDEQDIVISLTGHVEDFCHQFPRESVGDAMAVLKATIDNDRWDKFLKSVD